MNTILITGASKGIGLETAIELAKTKENHIILASRDYDKLLKFREANLASGINNITILKLDLTNEEDYKMLETALEKTAKIDVLINNAGLLINKPFEELTMEDWRDMFDVNLFGTVKMIKTLLPKLKQSKAPHIVNIGSMGGFQGSSKFRGLSGYSASKSAIANLTESLSSELGPYNIKCNCLCLGAVNTEMLATAFPGYKAPLESHEIAELIAWFSVNGHRFFNGQVLPVALNDPN